MVTVLLAMPANYLSCRRILIWESWEMTGTAIDLIASEKVPASCLELDRGNDS